jgi:hypothetical protein
MQELTIYREITALAIILMLWLVPAYVADWALRRKGYPRRWTWVALVPILGWVMLVVSWLLPPHSEQRASAEAAGVARVPAAGAPYQEGMKRLGNSLIALGILASLVSLIALIPQMPETFIMSGIVGAFAVVYFVLGAFARRLHAWVNYVVLAFGGYFSGFNLAHFAESRRPEAGWRAFGAIVGVVVPGLLACYAIRNILMYRALGSDTLVPEQDEAPLTEAPRTKPKKSAARWIIPLVFAAVGFVVEFATQAHSPPRATSLGYNLGACLAAALWAGLLGIVINMLRRRRRRSTQVVLILIAFFLVAGLFASCGVQPGRSLISN